MDDEHKSRTELIAELRALRHERDDLQMRLRNRVGELVALARGDVSPLDETQSILDSSIASHFLLDRERRIARLSPLAVEGIRLIRGKTLAKGALLEEYLPQEIRQSHIAFVTNALEGKPAATRYLLRYQDGDEHWFEVDYAPIFDVRGAVSHVCIWTRRIDEQVRSLEALQASQALFRQRVENLPVGIVEMSADGTILYANPAFCSLVGEEEDRLIDKRIWDFHLSPVDEAMAAAAQLMRGDGQGKLTYPAEFRTASGGAFHAQLDWIRLTQGHSVPAELLAVVTDTSARVQAEAARDRSEARLRSIFENVSQGILMLDRELRVLAYNQIVVDNVREMSGQDLAEGVPFIEYLPAAIADFAAVQFHKVLEGAYGHHEVELPLGEAGLEWHEFELTPIRDNEGAVTGICVCVINIHSRKVVEAKLQETYAQLEGRVEEKTRELAASQDRYTRLASVMSDMVWIVNSENRVLYASPSVHRALGYTPEELAALAPKDCLVEASLEHARQMIAAHLPDYEGGADSRPPLTLELEHIRKDGSPFWVEATIDFIFEKPGEFPVMLGVSRDISVRREAEDRIRRNEEQLRLFVEHTPAAIAMVDIEMRYVMCSQRWLDTYRVTKEELLGHTHYELFPDTDRHWAEVHRRCLTGARESCEEELLVRSIGSQDWVRWEAMPWRDTRGEIAGSVLFFEIINERIRARTERRELEAKIQHAQKLESLGVLAGGIAHDFNNLLVGMMGNAALAQAELPPDSPAREYIEQVEATAQRAADLTRQLLAYSGKGRFVVQPVDPAHIVKEMTHLLATVISKKAVLRFDFAENVPLIEADATQLRQIIMNLITNASDALEDKPGVITLRTGVAEVTREYLTDTYVSETLPDGPYAFVEVSDTGSGMDKETAARIFEPFFTTKFTGRGLGLAAVLGIVRGHGGAIKLYSEPGRGTTFRVLFPCMDRTAVPPEEPAAAPKRTMGAGLILVVDDEETVRALSKKVLERSGYMTLTACDGRDALKIYELNHERIDAVFLDMTMPHLDGVETFRAIRRIRPDAQVILTSGYNEQDATNRFEGRGLAGFIQKPFTPTQLIEKIQSVVAPRKA